MRHIDVAYLDFAKAFDTVFDLKLLLKLAGYSIKDHLAGSIKAFLLTAIRELKWSTVSQPQFQLKYMCQLKLSFSKCSVLQLGKICVSYSYALNGVILPLVKNMFDLEITVDYNLDFKLYVNNICFKAKQRPSLFL